MKTRGCAAVLVALFLLAGVALAEEPKQDTTNNSSPSELRARADAAVAAGNFKEAISLYSKLIEKEPTPSAYFKRSLVYLRQRKYSEVLMDLNKILSMDKNHKQALAQRAKLHKMRGDCASAKVDFELLRQIDPSHASAAQEIQAMKECSHFIAEGDRFFARGDFRQAHIMYTQSINVAADSASLLLKRARCDELSGDWQSVLADTRQVLQSDDSNLDALGLRAKAYYMIGEIDPALSHYRAGLRLDPENPVLKPAYKKLKLYQNKVTAGDSSMDESQFKDAVESYQEALELESTHPIFATQSQLRLCRAFVKGKMGKEAVQACTQVLARDESLVEGWTLRGDARILVEEYQEAVNDYQKANELSPNDSHVQQGLRNAQLELKKSQRKDHYKVLGVPRDASSTEIKKAFRALALKWHPDKNAKEDADKCEKMFRDIGEAYEVLSNEESRRKFDAGEDIQMDPGFNPHQHFHPFGGQHFTFTFG